MILKHRLVVHAFAALAVAFATSALAQDTPPRRQPPEQKVYASPDDAAQALSQAMRGTDNRELAAVLGRGGGRLVFSGDRDADAQTRADFVAAYDASHRVETSGGDKATLILGANEYPFPFPLVKNDAGWRFDAATGAEEIVARRIGANELAAMQVCLAYVDAQREYVLKDRDANGFLEYAQKLASTPGQRDGLYWETKEGEPLSPFGPIAVQERRPGQGERDAYHGYRYKILTAQGPSARGGEFDYVVKGKMIGGFALIAYPARYGVSGVMSFIVNQEGVIYEKNLGKNTREVAGKIIAYDPDSSWTKVE